MAAKSNSIEGYIDMVDEYFKKLPQLPKNARDAIVSITPWLALIFGILGVAASLVGLGLFTFLSPLLMLGATRAFGTGYVTVILGLAASVLLLLGFPGTQKKQEKGWRMIYYSEVVNLLVAIISISLSGVLFSLVGFYFLYQIRSYYSK